MLDYIGTNALLNLGLFSLLLSFFSTMLAVHNIMKIINNFNFLNKRYKLIKTLWYISIGGVTANLGIICLIIEGIWK